MAAATFGGVASDQSVRANEQATLARQQAQAAQAAKLAAEATELEGSQPDLAALLAVQGVTTDPSQPSWTSLENVLNRPTELSRVLYGDTRFQSAAYSPVGSPFPQANPLSIGGVEGLAFSRDGKDIATLGSSLDVWNVSTHAMIRQLVGTTNLFVGSVAFSPDGEPARHRLPRAGPVVEHLDLAAGRARAAGAAGRRQHQQPRLQPG